MSSFKNKIVFPDYDNSILNITASLLDLFGCEANYKPLPELSKEYFNNFENIVFFVVDGLGSEILKLHLPEDSLFRSNQVKTLTSVFPSTTSAAISSFLSGISPFEHGIIGWTLYFKEYFKMIDFLPLWDGSTGESLPEQYTEIQEIMHFDSIFKKIHTSNPKIEQHWVNPAHLTKSKYNRMAADTAAIYSYTELKDAFEYVGKAVKANDKNKLFYCYAGNPDKTMHKLGIDSTEITDIIVDIQQHVENLRNELKGTKTLIMVTADHGLLNVENPIIVNEEKDLWDSIILPTFPEPRFVSFFVKEDKKEQFKNFFADKKDDFLVFTKEEFLAKGLLGNGTPHERLADTLGNYFVIGIGNKCLHTKYATGKKIPDFKAMHAGLTAMEMLVPLILID